LVEKNIDRRDVVIRVLLADDHEIVRLGLRSVLEGAEDIDVVGEVATAEAAVSAAQAGGIDVILMDLRFGAGVEGTRVMGGAEATAQIRSAMATPPKVLVVTNYDTDADILGAIEAGAVGYLLKDKIANPFVRLDPNMGPSNDHATWSRVLLPGAMIMSTTPTPDSWPWIVFSGAVVTAATAWMLYENRNAAVKGVNV